MPSKIRVLDEHTINKIAAGEVIENPSSVVKELVENSLDAGAKEIFVEITGGGRQMIRVSDDGSGMDSDDALLCLERHATSKIRDVEEISKAYTMGFRGEAIPSIASISKFTLLTSSSENKGTLVLVEGGKIHKCVDAIRSVGTTIEVKSLFYNVPVRRKFQKSPAYDTNEIVKMLSLLALGNLDVSFSLVSNEKVVFSTKHVVETFSEQLRTRIEDVLGQEFLLETCDVGQSDNEFSLKGIVGFPGNNRHNRSAQFLFINKRAVVCPLINYLIKEAYGTSLPSGRHPVFVLHITLPGELVDVNVHPQKREVRLRQDSQLKSIINQAIQSALQPRSPILNNSTDFVPQEHGFSACEPPKFIFERAVTSPKSSTNESWAYQEPVREETSLQTSFAFQEGLRKQTPKILTTLPKYLLLDPSTLDLLTKERYASPSAGLFLVDQKAAFARVIFENIECPNSQPKAVQSLLIPYTFDLPPTDAHCLRTYLDEFNKMGIQIREFGQNSFLVDALDQTFSQADIKTLIENLLEDVAHAESNIVYLEKIKKIAMAASKSAKGYTGQLSVIEGQILVERLFKCQDPYSCPLGKPTIMHLSTDDLAKQFQKR